MKIIYFREILVKGWWLFAAIILFALFWTARAAMAESVQAPSGERLITIYDRGQEQTVVTRATTVREALKEVDIEVSAVDVIEPRLDSVLIAKQYSVNIYRARPVVVTDGITSTRVMTAAQSPEQITKAAKTTLYDEDQTKLERVDDVLAAGGAGLKLNIDRATAFTLTLYGKSFTARTQATTVGGMLTEKGIVLGTEDGVSLPDETSITAGMAVAVWRNGVQTVTQEEAVTMPVRQIKDTEKEIGYKQVQTPGKDGKKQVTYEVNTQNGQEVSRKVIQTVVTEQPTEQVEIVGAKLPTPTNPTENQALGHQMMLNFGYGEDQWGCLYNLWMKESGWRVNAENPSSGAYGIPQALPATKMATYGSDYRTNAATQITWGLHYIKGRYQTPCGAWSTFQRQNWY